MQVHSGCRVRGTALCSLFRLKAGASLAAEALSVWYRCVFLPLFLDAEPRLPLHSHQPPRHAGAPPNPAGTPDTANGGPRTSAKVISALEWVSAGRADMLDTSMQTSC